MRLGEGRGAVYGLVDAREDRILRGVDVVAHVEVAEEVAEVREEVVGVEKLVVR